MYLNRNPPNIIRILIPIQIDSSDPKYLNRNPSNIKSMYVLFSLYRVPYVFFFSFSTVLILVSHCFESWMCKIPCYVVVIAWYGYRVRALMHNVDKALELSRVQTVPASSTVSCSNSVNLSWLKLSPTKSKNVKA